MSSVFKVDKISDSMHNIAKLLRRFSPTEERRYNFTLFKQEKDPSNVQSFSCPAMLQQDK